MEKPNKIVEPPPPANDSDFLKRILKIEENNSAPTSHSNTLTSAKAEPASYFTVQLLKEFQTRKLGCPNYQLFEVNNKFTAKVMMPDGSYVFGEPAKNRDLASENAAKEALNIICKTKIAPQKSETVTVSTADTNITSKDSPRRPKTDRVAVKAQIMKHLDIQPLVNKGFVPLQAVHNQNNAANVNKDDAVIDSNVPKTNHLQEPLKPTIATNTVPPQVATPVKRRERKMRLAANFPIAMKTGD